MKGMPGFLHIVRSEEGEAAWIAAVATDGWTAEQALTRMEPGFKVAGGVETDAVEAAMNEALHKADAHRIHSAGDLSLVKGGMPVQRATKWPPRFTSPSRRRPQPRGSAAGGWNSGSARRRRKPPGRRWRAPSA
ncbi:hypothetical protein ACFSHP_06025 [Novosphingobium panipatense]